MLDSIQDTLNAGDELTFETPFATVKVQSMGSDQLEDEKKVEDKLQSLENRIL